MPGASLNVLVLDGTLAAAALVTRQARACAGRFVVFSETGAALAARTGRTRRAEPAGRCLLVTQVVPHPTNLSHPLVAEFQKALATEGTKVAMTDPPAIAGRNDHAHGEGAAPALTAPR